jgi:hypothetical protein
VFVDQIEARLARIREEAQSLRDRLAILADQESELQIALKWAKTLDAESPLKATASLNEPSPNPAAAETLTASPQAQFFGQSLAVAAASLIKSRGHPLSEDDILEGLRAGGVRMVSERPIVNLRFALRRRPDLVISTGGKWDVVPDADLTPPPSGAVARSPDHLRKTMEGLAAAKERGVSGGRRTLLPKRELFYQLLEGGLTAKQASERAGVSKSTAYNWIAGDKEKSQASPKEKTDLEG